jgi:hypothetical protein
MARSREALRNLGVASLIDLAKFRQLLDPGAAASVAIHVALLAGVLVFSGIRPFNSESAKAITVDLVAPEELELAAKPETPPKPDPVLPQLDLKESLDTPSPPQQPTPPAPQQQQAAPKPSPAQAPPAATQQAAVQPQQPPPQASPLPPAAPAYRTPEPDVTIKYGVMLGLPESGGKADFDSEAFKAANVAKVDIAAFRRHLKTCSPMPDGVAPSDDVKVKLRVMFKPDGRLAAPPVLIAGSASLKGPALMQGAIAALTACQPYAMLPADKYDEWKILDLEFSPHDFHLG